MNPTLLLLLIPPILIAATLKWRLDTTISWREAAVLLVAPMALIAIVWNVSRYAQMADVEIINGKVTGKEQVYTSCSHSYQCNCVTTRSGSGANATSTTTCQTCYQHANDWNWQVSTSVGDFNIDRIDSRGSHEPPRWTAVAVGEPVARAHSYRNYIRAAPDSLFHAALAQSYAGPLPDYPDVYDYHRADRVIAMPGVRVPDLADWNRSLSYALNDLGPLRQVNVVVVLTDKDPAFADALEASWLGGKKNDVLVVIGTDYPAIRWVRVRSWSVHDIVNVELRNALLDEKALDPARTIGTISDVVQRRYERKPMADFAYLAEEAQPPTWAIVLALVLGLAASTGLGVLFHRERCLE